MPKVKLPSPSMAVAVTALAFAVSGVGYAATQLGHGGAKAHAAKKKGRRGPPGPPGANGLNGTNGTNGAPGNAGPTQFIGHIDGLNTAMNSHFYAGPSGTSTAQSTQTAAVAALDAPLTATHLTVTVNNAPGGTAEREFFVNGEIAGDGTPCLIFSGGFTCSITQNNLALGANDLISIHSEVIGGAASAATASFAWTAH